MNTGTAQAAARFPDLEDKVAVVTGASRGVGVGIARYLGRQGMRLVLGARSREAGEAFAAELSASGVACAWVTADVATAEGAQRVFDKALERFAGIDVLVNNAAMLQSKGFLDLDENAYAASFERNVRMVYGLSRRAARHMVERGRGSIVNISSVGGLRAHRGLAGYDASKGAINALTRSMAVDLAPHHIRVNAVALGRMGSGAPKQIAGIPLQRHGTGDDAGAAVAFLASASAAYVTGQVVYVDGGLTAQLTPPGFFI